jgi:hypothetical protein
MNILIEASPADWSAFRRVWFRQRGALLMCVFALLRRPLRN